MAKQKEEKKNRKVLFGFLFLFVAVGIIVGTVFAFFSDVIIGGGTATAGTLDITGSFTMKHYNAAGTELTDTNETNTTIPNLNPGDLIHISGAATNAGNKSAHVRGNFALSGDLASLVKVVAGTTTKTLAGCTGAAALTPAGGPYLTAAAILNGTGANAETEGAGVSSYNQGILICLPSTTGNAAQGKALSIDAKVQAVQYRNNTAADWSDVVTSAFGS
ncbi:MAG: M73 family metallopeptidase [Candidatus Nomurabacteria bacterium]|jgi:hypothetical protein|nr:M73 family metallopeptidase [Candidatus Nomurabacteria bacterium]